MESVHLACTDRTSTATGVKNGELAERIVHKRLPYLPRTVGSGCWRGSNVSAGAWKYS